MDNFNDVADLRVKVVDVILFTVRIIFPNIISDCFFNIKRGDYVVASGLEYLDSAVFAGEHYEVLGVSVELSEVQSCTWECK